MQEIEVKKNHIRNIMNKLHQHINIKTINIEHYASAELRLNIIISLININLIFNKNS